jgi:hypothetical protein
MPLGEKCGIAGAYTVGRCQLALPTRGNPTASRAGAAGFNQGDRDVRTIDYTMQKEIKQAVEAAVAAAQLKVAEAVAKLIK